MNFKKLFIGGLCVTAALASCTKELAVAPSAEGIDSAISLGEGLTITGTKGDFGVDTKSVWDWNGKQLVASWSDGDQIGAAFYNYLSYSPAGQPQSNRFDQFMTNFYFDRTDTGVKAEAEFQSPTNMLAGAYVLYFPYDPTWIDVNNQIPVVVNYPQTMDIDAPYAHLSEDMFSCVNYAAIKGGTDLSSKFQMKSVTNVLSLNFKVDNVKLMELAGKIDIAQVYIETAANVMYSEGYIEVPKDEVDYTKALADPRENYKPETAVHQVLVNLNKTSDDYTISKTNTPTEDVHVSVLPFDELSLNSKLYVKVVTSDGRVYSSADLTATDTGLEYLNKYATAKGIRIPMTITLTTEDTHEIYTEEEFKAQWNAAVAGTKDETLTVGTDLVVKDFPMTKSNEGVKISINNKNNATLTVEGDLTLEDGMLEVNLPLTVDGDFTFGNNANISGQGTLSVTGQTTIDGAAATTNIKIVKMNDVAISRTGEFKINGSTTTKVGKIVNRGKLTLENIKIESLENKADNGAVTISGNDVVVTGTLNNYGTISGTLHNRGTVNLFKITTATIVNEAAIPAQGLSAGTINVNETLNLKCTNNSTINVAAGKTLTLNSAYTGDGIINAEGASVNANYLNSFAGEIVIDDLKKIQDKNSALTNSVILVVNEDIEAEDELVKTYRIKSDKFTLATDKKVELYAGAKWTIGANVKPTVVVFGNATITNSIKASVAFASESEVKAGTLTLSGASSSAVLTASGTIFVKDSNSVKVGNNVTATSLTKKVQ